MHSQPIRGSDGAPSCPSGDSSRPFSSMSASKLMKQPEELRKGTLDLSTIHVGLLIQERTLLFLSHGLDLQHVSSMFIA